MGKEIYRSFEGKLNAGESGIIVEELKDYYEITQIAAVFDKPTTKFRVAKSEVHNMKWSDDYEIGRLEVGVWDGVINGAILVEGKWYPTDTIKSIQAAHEDYNWGKYI